MSDAYIPQQKDNAGNFFAFIRFLKVKDYNWLVDNLNSVKIDGAKITANIAKYDKNGNRIWNSHERNSGAAFPKNVPRFNH